MDLQEIRQLIQLMKKNSLSVFKLEQENFKITLKTEGHPLVSPSISYLPHQPVATGPVPPAEAVPIPSPEPPSRQDNLREIVSPMVGTFYLAPAPDAAPYVEVGQSVTPDTVVCIVEAMKVMNEIKAEVSGVIAEIAAENGKPVQFGQPLFRLR